MKELKNGGTSRYMPWLVVMSDGLPEGKTTQITAERMAVLDEVSQELARRVKLKQLTTFSIGIGKYNNKEVMDKLSPGPRKSVHLQSYADGSQKFSDFFTWLSSSVGATSASIVDKVQIQPVSSWAEGWDAIETGVGNGSTWSKPL